MSSHFQIGILPSERPLDTSLRRHFGADSATHRLHGRACRGRASADQGIGDQGCRFRFPPCSANWRASGCSERRRGAAALCATLTPSTSSKHLRKWVLRLSNTRWIRRAVRIDLFEQMLNKGHEIRLGAMIGNLHGPSSAFGFDRHEQVAGAAPYVLVIQSHGRSWLDRQGLARILEQLLALLVQANDRFSRPERASVQIQQIVHPLPVLFRQSADAPHQLAPRLDAVFFSSRRIVSRLIGPTSASCCAPPAQAIRVSSAWPPAGGAEQAKAEICASTSAPYRRVCLDVPRHAPHMPPRPPDTLPAFAR